MARLLTPTHPAICVSRDFGQPMFDVQVLLVCMRRNAQEYSAKKDYLYVCTFVQLPMFLLCLKEGLVVNFPLMRPFLECVPPLWQLSGRAYLATDQ